MTRIPADIDSLIWQLAESRNDAAIAQFRGRHPEYVKELDARLNMVTGLRAAKPPHLAAPRRESARKSERPVDRRGWTIAGGLGIAAAAAASFTAAYYLIPREPAKSNALVRPPTPPVSAYNVAPRLEQPVIVNPPADPATPVGTTPSTTDVDVPRYLRPQTVTIRQAKLSSALQLIAAQGGLGIIIGPGLADPAVNVDYEGMTTIEILQDMGRRYAFTPFDQGDGSVIVVPVRDSGEVPNPNGSPQVSDGKRVQTSP